MAESLLLPVVRGVLGKAAGALVQSVTRMCGVDGDRRKLERQLLAVQCKLADAKAKSELKGVSGSVLNLLIGQNKQVRGLF